MINITKEKGYVVITSDDEKTFLIGEGILSVPCNTIEYTLDDESDFIQFNSIYEDGILFVGTIGNIQVNGTLVTRDNIIESLDSVFNNDSGGSASAGVNSLNGFQGDVNIKSINGESLIGSGDITIEGGSGSSGVEGIDVGGTYLNGMLSFSTSVESSDGSWRVELNGDMYDLSTDEYYGNGGSLIFGVKSSDNSILVSDGGSLADLVINPDILSGGTEYTAGVGITIEDNTIKSDLTVMASKEWIDSNYYNQANTYTKTQIDALIAANSGSTTDGVTAINVGFNENETYKKKGVVSMYTEFSDTSYDINIQGTTFFGLVPSDSSILLENGGGVANGNFRCGIKVNEWVGTQTEYDALGTYDSACTYYITE